MKNYYDQKHELEIAYMRLDSLKEKREIYFINMLPGGIRYDQPVVMGGNVTDVLASYVAKVEDIDKKITEVQNEIYILEKHLAAMEQALRNMTGVLEKIFVLKYIDGYSINQICKKINYSRPQVYRKLKIIRKKIKDETK